MRQKIGILCCDNTLYIVIQKELRLNFLLYALSLLLLLFYYFFPHKGQGHMHTCALPTYVNQKRVQFEVKTGGISVLTPLGEFATLIFFLTREKYDDRPWSRGNRFRRQESSTFLALFVPSQPRLAVSRERSHARLSEATLAESGIRRARNSGVQRRSCLFLFCLFFIYFK